MRIATPLIFLMATALPLTAQSLEEACSALSQIEIGDWAEYRMSTPDPQGPTSARFAVVSSEDHGGELHYWHEMKMTTDKGEMIMQVLVPSFPYDEGEIQGVVMKMGDQPAMRMPAQALAMMKQQGGGSPTSRAADLCARAEVVGWETVEVPAGSFDAMHLKSTEGGEEADVWISMDIPFGMVRVLTAKGEEMLLVNHGEGAESSINEVPREMPGMGGG